MKSDSFNNKEESNIDLTEDELKLLDWQLCNDKNLNWINIGIEYAVKLKKEEKFNEAIETCERILKEFPSFSKAKKEYGWNLYYELKKTKKDRIDIEEIATKIISLCERMEPYTAYVSTCLLIADYYLNDMEEFSQGKKWLNKLDISSLKVEKFEYHQHEEVMYWSQRRRYIELKAKYFLLSGNLEKSIWTYICLLDQHDNSKAQTKLIQEDVCFQIERKYGRDDEDLICSLLKKRGFLKKIVRENYYNMLQRRFKMYGGYDEAEEQPVFMPDHQVIAIRIAKEILTPVYKNIRPANKKYKLISATELANFSFCPASYAIQASYNLKSPVVANMGTMMHDRKMLVINKRNETKKSFFLFSKTKDYKNIDENVITQNIKQSIKPLLDDIASSELVFHGHDTNRNKVFYNKESTLNGTPDYIFKKKDGTTFIVEEKFSLQKKNTKSLDKPYDSHRIQLGAYTMLLEEIKACYGYIIYWSYTFNDVGMPYVSKAQAFRLESSAFFENEVKNVFCKVSKFKSEGISKFESENVNPWKCVNCIVTELCMHKTCIKQDLHIPYIKNQEYGCSDNQRVLNDKGTIAVPLVSCVR